MRFDLIDDVVEQSAARVVTRKSVTVAEEYLQDHFPDFPVLPGVLMLEVMVQAARRLLAENVEEGPWVVHEVRQIRYGSFVRPGQSLLVTVDWTRTDGETYRFTGNGQVEATTAVHGKFTLRRLRERRSGA